MPANINSPDRPVKPMDGLLSLKEAAAYLGMSEAWLCQTRVPYAKLGRRRLYRRADLDSFVEQNMSRGSPREHP